MKRIFTIIVLILVFSYQKSLTHIGKLCLFIITVTIAGLFLSVLTSPSKAASGDLDLFFGNGGKITTAIGNGGSASAIAIQSDGKIVVAVGILTNQLTVINRWRQTTTATVKQIMLFIETAVGIS